MRSILMRALEQYGHLFFGGASQVTGAVVQVEAGVFIPCQAVEGQQFERDVLLPQGADKFGNCTDLCGGVVDSRDHGNAEEEWDTSVRQFAGVGQNHLVRNPCGPGMFFIIEMFDVHHHQIHPRQQFVQVVPTAMGTGFNGGVNACTLTIFQHGATELALEQGFTA